MLFKRFWLVVVPLLGAGCAGTEVNDSAQVTTAAVLVTTLALLADDDSKDKRREYRPGEWTYCDISCKFQQEITRQHLHDKYAHRKRREEAADVHTEFSEFIGRLETAEHASGQPTPSVMVKKPNPEQ